MTETVFTIGHSTQSIELFVDLLKQHGISVVADVRSAPYSRMNPQFNREALKKRLRDSDIKYVFLGKELGARSEDRSCYCNGQVQYDLLARTELFKSGIERIKDGSNKFRIAMMCAEKEPLDCHRTILVSRVLAEFGLSVAHILFDGRLERHEDAMSRLVSMMRIPNADMFREHSSVLRDAYDKRGKEIAYREDNTEENDRSQQQLSSRLAE